MLNKRAFKLQLITIFSAFLVFATTLIIGHFVSASVVQNQLIAQGYVSNSTLQPGMIVRLDSKDSSKVVVLDQTNIQKMLGVVIVANDSALTLSQTTNAQEVYVSNYGQHNVLVTNQNGPIRIGDYVTVSALSGVGMKADANEPIVLGQAAGSFDGVSGVVSSAALNSPNGQKNTVNIGSVPVDINIANNPLAQGTKGVPVFLSKIAKYATNKSVSASKVYLAMLCVLAGLIVTVTIIYSGIKSGLISIGRNPLAKKAIVLNLIKIVIVSVIIFAISLGGAYAIVSQ